METWPGLEMTTERWHKKAREYFDLAVSLLKQALEGASRLLKLSLPEHTSPSATSNIQNLPLPMADSDELLPATATLFSSTRLTAHQRSDTRITRKHPSAATTPPIIAIAYPSVPVLTNTVDPR